MKIPTWNDIEHDARLGLVLLADGCRHMVARDNQEDAVGPAMLGLKELPESFLEELAKDRQFLTSVSISATHFAACIRHCFDLITVLRPLEEIDLEEEKAEGAAWLAYYLSLIPTETVGGVDCRHVFRDPKAPLVTLLGMAQA